MKTRAEGMSFLQGAVCVFGPDFVCTSDLFSVTLMLLGVFRSPIINEPALLKTAQVVENMKMHLIFL